MTRTHRRAPSVAWIYAGLGAVFAVIGLAIVSDLAGHGLAEVFHPALVLLWGIPFAVAALLFALAFRGARHRPVIVSFGPDGVTVAQRAPIPWSDIGEIVHTTQWAGYGPHDHLIFRRRFTPSDIAATGAERVVHNLFTAQSFAPVMADRTVDEMLAEIDSHLADAGLARAEPPRKRFRLVMSVRRWEVRRADQDDAPQSII